MFVLCILAAQLHITTHLVLLHVHFGLNVPLPRSLPLLPLVEFGLSALLGLLSGTPSFGYIVLFTAFTCLVSVLGYRHVWPYLAEFSGAIGETGAHCVAFKYFLSQS